jgi:hypothetical protein
MEFNGGGGIVGLNPGGGFVPTNLVPQNQANLDYVNAVNQASLNPNTLYGPGGFGYQTNQYSAAGAAYGRQTGYYGDPYSSTPVSPSSGAGYADRSTLSEAGQAYYDAHVARYGAPPYADNPGVQGPAGPPAPPAPSVMQQAAASDAGGGAGIGVGPRTDPGEGAAVYFNNLNAQQQSYYQAHVAKYGTAPGVGNTTLSGMANAGGPSSGGGAGTQLATPFSPSGPVASDPYSGGGHPTDPGEGAALDPSTFNAAQKAYSDAHVLKYNTLPGANNATMKSLADAPPMEEAPPNSPGGLVGAGGFSPTTTIGGGGGSFKTDPGEGGALTYDDLNPAQQAYYNAHTAKYGTAPGSGNSTIMGLGGPFQSATGDAGQSPGMAPGMGGFSPAGFRTDPGEGAPVVYENFNPAQQDYFRAHYEKYGTAPGANNTTLSGMGDGASFNERFTGSPGADTSGVAAINKAAGIDPNTGLQFGVPPSVPPPTAPGAGGALEFTGNPVNYDDLNKIQPGSGSFIPTSPRENWLAEQRAPIATSIADNPDLLAQLAARIYTEDSNNPQGQQAVFEAMLNNQLGTRSVDKNGNILPGADMLGPGYYPKPGTTEYDRYQKNVQLMQNNPGLLGQMREIMAKVFQGSNVSNMSFGWSQGGSDLAAQDLAAARQTYSSPKTGQDYNVFYQPTGGRFGQGNVDNINKWLSQMPP